MTHLPALVTLLTVLLLFGTMFVVGKMRGRHGIKAPATSGHPAFDRAYRVQMNTLEGTVMFLPVLWLAAEYGFSGWAGIAGLVWLLGRVWYAWSYLKDPASREKGFAVAMLAWLAVLVMAAIGVCRALMLG
ncbi:membrane-associated protein in eicosanoid and glutathione metabolism (MAPEG) [Rhodanobacter fulvus Jip2]|uniref:Membrane-associated protein in eicosanoid and glutathione metabolism (MAPEG) n=1 Tax=Rhodanobacter fulvus Jip2 TaxID=1163408 RepID=I4VJE3_9GAMM|nr:MAPEG family protein [Rhodanobacter fulvus]EIL87334.1 membrane-associated protein in eicosanoid and glutathione metabolism (MAPEG) [Rhodanobacter fulvus Jip2]